MHDIATEERTSILGHMNTENVLSRSDLRNLKADSRLQMISKNPYLDTIWGGFSINEISTNPPIAFHVVRHNSIFVNTKFDDQNFVQDARNLIFKFNKILVNSGQCWNIEKHIFTAPVDGVYIFSYSMTIKAWRVKIEMKQIIHEGNKTVSVNKRILLESHKDDTDKVFETVSGSTIEMLNEGDSIFIARFENLYVNIYDQASLRGFLYKPTAHVNAVWSARNSPYAKIDNNHDIEFTDIFINIGDVFKKQDQNRIQLIIPASGVYCVILKTALPPNNEIALFINDVMTQLKIKYKLKHKLHLLETYERSLLVQASVNDSLSVQLLTTYNDQASGYHIYFAGLIIVPI